MSLASLTAGMRHKIVKLVAPKMYADWSLYFAPDNINLQRPMISFLQKLYGDKPLVGCEVGVREGINALRIMQSLNVKKLFLVDPYMPYFEPLIPECATEAYHHRMMTDAKKRLAMFGERVVWLRETSDKALKDISVQLDFCYLDGDHNGEQVWRDIQNYGGIIKSGGVLGGHDFNLTYPSLCGAVLREYRFAAMWKSLHGAYFDWWMIKQ